MSDDTDVLHLHLHLVIWQMLYPKRLTREGHYESLEVLNLSNEEKCKEMNSRQTLEVHNKS